MPDNDLEGIRERIGRIDNMVLEVLTMRQQAASEAEKAKRKEGLEIYDPDREAAELARIVALAKKKGLPLDEEAIAAIFRPIFEQSRRLQEEQRREASAQKAARLK
jgi:3-deoxy-7-phosphoheptulonate synthase/chorismate mutase